jgi:hypothetical protein
MSASICPNCAAPLPEAAGYCAQCGQAAIRNENFKGLLEQFLGDYFTFDSKITRSLLPLVASPGELTLEYMRGRRARYIPPLRMFIFLSILFFLVIGGLGAGREGAVALDELEDRVFWDNFFTSVLPKLFFLFLPLFAFLVHLLYRDRPANFIKPFILSAHFHAFVFLAFTCYGLISRPFAAFGLVAVNRILITLLTLYVVFYLWIALRKVFPRPTGRHLMKFMSLLGLYSLLLVMAAVLSVWSLRS